MAIDGTSTSVIYYYKNNNNNDNDDDGNIIIAADTRLQTSSYKQRRIAFLGPQVGRDHPLDLSISLSGEKRN